MNRGTLITDDIHELELELELLKRKRLMVQQQQTLLASQQNYSRQPGFDYQHSSQQFNQQTNRPFDMSQEQNRTRNFSHLYDGPNQQHGLKRHAPDSAFHTSPPAKRFSGPQGGKPNKGPKGLPKPWDVDPIDTLQTMQRSLNQPQALMSFEKFKKNLNFNPSVSRPAHFDFKPNKVTKPNIDNTPKYKPRPVPATHKGPVTRNNPVAQSSETTKKSHYEYVLRANDTPDNLVNGRLEFAMGHILKEIRGKFEGAKKYSRIFTMAPQRETIKKILRQRIRCAMLDKVVGAGHDIIIEYRKMYPQHTDKEILELTLLSCKETKIPKSCIQLEEPGPKQYFMENFNKLFDVELDKMFEKIKNLYMDEHKVNTKTMQEIINDNIPEPVHVEISTTDDNATESGIKTTSKDEPEPNKEPAFEDTKVPAGVTNADKQQDHTKLKEKRSTAVIDETKPPNDKDLEIYCAWKHYNAKFFQSEFYDKLIIFGINQRLHEILPKKRQDIMAIFEIRNMYTAAKEKIMLNTMEKLSSTKNKAVKPATPATPAAAAEETTKPMDVSKYFVRVVGRPHLPNKKTMKEFLDEFNPTSIKKHRQLSYLLFVGFSNKEDYEKLLRANGTSIDGDQVQAEGVADVLTLSMEEAASGDPEDYEAVLPEPDPRYKAVLQEPDPLPFEDFPTAPSALNIQDAVDTSVDDKAQPELVDVSHPAVPADIQACTNEGAVTKKRNRRKKRGGCHVAAKTRERRKKVEERRKRECEKDKSEENCRLLMTASDVSQSAKPCTDTNADDDVILVEDNKTMDNSSDVSNIISSDLDEQITDLLSSIRKAEEISESQSPNEEKGDTVAETKGPEVINLTDDTSSLKGDLESAPVADSQMQADDVNQEQSPNEEKGDTVAETKGPEVIKLTDDTSSLKEDLESAPVADSQMQADDVNQELSPNEDKGDTVAETQGPEVINLADDTSSVKEDLESAPVADSQMQADDMNQERMVTGADAELNKIHGDKLSVETKVTAESNENKYDDLNTKKQDKSDNTKPDETKNEEASNTSAAETEEDKNQTEKENRHFVAEETKETNMDTNKTEEKTEPALTEEITEPNKDTNDTEVINKPTVMEEVIEIKDNDEEKTPIENKTVATVKDTTKSTPVRASSRLANSTPSRVTTRRTSKLAQQNNQ